MDFVKNINDVDYTETIQNLITLYFEHNYEDICKILNVKYNPDYKSCIDEKRYNINNVPVNKYYNNGMIFYSDKNPVTLQRVKIDEETTYLLNTLLMTTTHIIDESDLINLIIEKWVEQSALKTVSKIKEETINIFTVGECTRSSIEVGKESWNSLIKICRNNRIALRNGFKMSLLSYFNEIYNNYTNNRIIM